MIETIAGYRITGRKGLSHWHALMEELLLVIERYSRVTAGEDGIYLYTERACVGAMAAAAWRCGWIALEEFQLEKSSKERAEWLGRSDLYMATNNQDEFIEAKYQWISMTSRTPLSEILEATLARAVADARNAQRNDDESTFIGVSFTPVYAAESQYSGLENLIEKSVGSALKSKAHAVAWCFPKEMRSFVSASKNLNPGVIVAASNIDFVKA